MWRTNYFRVKDVDAFFADIAKLSCRTIVKNSELNLVVLLDDESGETSYTYYYCDIIEDWVVIDWYDLAKKHLQENEVIIFQLISNAKLRYLVGFSEAYTWRGEKFRVDIDDIYLKLDNAGIKNISPCEY